MHPLATCVHSKSILDVIPTDLQMVEQVSRTGFRVPPPGSIRKGFHQVGLQVNEVPIAEDAVFGFLDIIKYVEDTPFCRGKAETVPTALDDVNIPRDIGSVCFLFVGAEDKGGYGWLLVEGAVCMRAEDGLERVPGTAGGLL